MDRESGSFGRAASSILQQEWRIFIVMNTVAVYRVHRLCTGTEYSTDIHDNSQSPARVEYLLRYLP